MAPLVRSHSHVVDGGGASDALCTARAQMPAQYFPGEVSSDFYGSRPPLPTPTAPNVPDYLAHARDGDAGSPPATKPLVTIHPPFLAWNDTPLCR